MSGNSALDRRSERLVLLLVLLFLILCGKSEDMARAQSVPATPDSSDQSARGSNQTQLKELLDEFAKTRVTGTSFGNTLVRRYLENVELAKDATLKLNLRSSMRLLAISRSTHRSTASIT